MYPSIALMFLFCFLDNIIYVEEGKDDEANSMLTSICTVQRPIY
jgi:hypothetical protein